MHFFPHLFCVLISSALVAASPARQAPPARWRTIRTAHYRIHYPPPLAEWAQDVASRVEGIHAAVKELVGYESPRPVQVMLMDPALGPNGTAQAFPDYPGVVLWATAPESDQITDTMNSWTEELVTHEFTHIHHLTRPQNHLGTLRRLLVPLPKGPIGGKAPLWVIEGYATLCEGRLTGSGRPHSALRAAYLRQWALQGKLPTYETMSRTGGFRGGNNPYLMGSAYLEWLERQRPEQPDVLRRLWKQLASRKRRTFDASFSATFGFSPQDGYGRFFAEVTHDALEWEARMKAEGLREGELWWRGPAEIPYLSVSPDGQRLLAEVLAPKQLGLQVWDLKPSAKEDPRILREKSKDALDPNEVEDVAPEFPAPKSVAFLPKLDLRVPERPQWVDDQTISFQLRRADEEGILQRRSALWRLKSGVELDPPVIPKPRWTLLEPVLREGRWVLEWNGKAVTLPGQPFGRAVLDEAASQLYAACILDGTPNLVRLPLTAEGFGEAQRLTRTASAAWNPAPTPDGKALYFTRLDARGLQIRKLDLSQGPLPAAPPGLEAPRLFNAATVQPPAIEPNPLPQPGPVPPSEPYQAAQNLWNLPSFGFSVSPSGRSWQGGYGGEDLVGRLSWRVLAAAGEHGGPGGAAGGFTYGGWAWKPTVSLFLAREKPSTQALEPRPGLDRQRLGAEFSLALDDKGEWPFWCSPVLGWEQDKALEVGTLSRRSLVGLRAIVAKSWARGSTGLKLWCNAQGYAGSDSVEAQSSTSWHGTRTQLGVGLLNALAPLTMKVEAGRLVGESFRLGGLENSLVPGSLDWNRLEQPGLPAFHATGDRFQRWRAEVGGRLRGYLEGTVLWSAGQPRGAYERVAGAEIVLAGDSVFFPRIPGLGPRRLQLTLGVHRILDGPLKNHGAFTASLIVRP